MSGCRIEGCPNPCHEGKGWRRSVCGTHHQRKTRTGAYDEETPIRRARACLVPGCTERHKALGYCLLHYRRFRSTGDPLGLRPAGGAGKPRKAEVGYMAAHHRVRVSRGKASARLCVCGEPAAQWAYDHSDPDERFETVRGSRVPFSTDLNRYRPLCVSCHRAFDRAFLAQKEG